jgi:MoCo/4Fe-4S cofactor protein with predicted Tat translocation signal
MSAGKTYWRSMGQLVDDPRSREFLDREFPEGASELPEGVTRRTMLTLMGASLSLAGLTACRRPVEKIVPYVSAPENVLPGVPQHYATTMPLGRSAYGVVVESHEGRPTKIEGNELHPSTSGASGTWVQASILDLYDPDRSQRVRHGEETSDWDAFAAQWATLEADFTANGGQGLAVVSETFASPTLERLVDRFRERFPKAVWATYEPINDESASQGAVQALGQAYDAEYHYDRAAVILALDSDFLLTDPESVRSAGEFAETRRVRGEHGTMSRLWAVESAQTLTGSNADHRLRLRPGQIAGFLGRLASELQSQGLRVNAPAGAFSAVEGADAGWVRALAQDLLAHRGAGILVVGSGQPPAVHAAALALNSALGNLGQTVSLHATAAQGRSSTRDLGKLVASARRGEIKALFVLGGNPLYDAPADLEFTAALADVEHTFHLSTHDDETSRACGWHLPRAHYLESWGDARARGGALSVVQPLIAPLYGGRTNLELLGLLATGEFVSGYETVRETWRIRLGEGGFEKRWIRLLHDGVFADSAGETRVEAAAVSPDRERASLASLGDVQSVDAGAALDLIFRPSASVYDGRFANVGWLQELPDAVTKITWDNAALVSPSTAASIGADNEQVVRLIYEGRELELPLWVVPGQADGCIVVDLGYGREAAGRVGNGAGFNAYALRTSQAPGFGSWAKVESTGRIYKLSETQHHDEMDELGEEEQAKRVPHLVRETTLDEFHQHPEFVRELEVEHPPLESLWREHSYAEGPQWGMSIDLNACTGCGSCTIACQSENNIPIVGKAEVANGREMHWIRVDRYFSGSPDEAQAVFQPIACMHCENAPCEQVCPVAATVHDDEGLNTMVYNRCIGTRYCANNCPYKVRRFNFFNFTKDTPEVQKMAANPDVTVRSRGVMEKCSLCTQRINRVRLDAKLAGREVRDGDIRTACEQACPSRAIRFGDIRDESSVVASEKKDPRSYVLLAELNNKPRTNYMGKLRNLHPDLREA